MLDVKEAVKKAFENLLSLYENNQIEDILLEEVEFNEETKKWLITLGFAISRKILFREGHPLALFNQKDMGLNNGYERVYKIFTIDAETGTVESMKIRTV